MLRMRMYFPMKIGQCCFGRSLDFISICLFAIFTANTFHSVLLLVFVAAVFCAGIIVALSLFLFHFCPFEVLLYRNMCLRQSDWDCSTHTHIHSAQCTLQMENKFVTVAHLQQIPELCLLIKAATTEAEKNNHLHCYLPSFTTHFSPPPAVIFLSRSLALNKRNKLQYVIITINKIYRIIVNS